MGRNAADIQSFAGGTGMAVSSEVGPTACYRRKCLYRRGQAPVATTRILQAALLRVLIDFSGLVPSL